MSQFGQKRELQAANDAAELAQAVVLVESTTQELDDGEDELAVALRRKPSAPPTRRRSAPLLVAGRAETNAFF